MVKVESSSAEKTPTVEKAETMSARVGGVRTVSKVEKGDAKWGKGRNESGFYRGKRSARRPDQSRARFLLYKCAVVNFDLLK